METKQQILNEFLEIKDDDFDQLEVSAYDENTFEYGSQEYMVLTDSEADEKANENIKESLWAFNADFVVNQISQFDDLSLNQRDALIKAIQTMQTTLCESANELILAMIDDLEDFTEEAIKADGRGHFMSSYDGDENEIDHEGEDYFIYRIN